MAEQKKQKSIHFSEMQRYLDLAYQHRQTVIIKAFRSDGCKVMYRGWLIHHQYWKGGYMRIYNPVSHQMRLLPEIFILEVNGMKVYL